MSFTNTEKIDIRRFCGYPTMGGIASPAFGYRFFTSYGTLEFKLSNLAAEEESVIRSIYLSGLNSLYTLEQAIFGATSNLDTDQASVWVHNKNEVRDRSALFNQVRMQLCGFLGVEAGPTLASSGRIRVVV